MRSVWASEIDIDRIWSENYRIWIEGIRSQSVSEIQGTIFAGVILDLEIINYIIRNTLYRLDSNFVSIASEKIEFRNLD